MSDKSDKEEAREFTYCLVGIVFGFILSLMTIYNFDSDRADLKSCEQGLSRDRYCVMLAVPSSVIINNQIIGVETIEKAN